MDYSKKILDHLNDSGAIVLPEDFSAEDFSVCFEQLTQFASCANTDVLLLRTELHSADAERIEKRILTTKAKLQSLHAVKLEGECDYFLQHLQLRGAENSLMLGEKLLSNILDLSIRIQVAKHQASLVIPDEASVSNDQLMTILLDQLQQALHEFNDEETLRIIDKLKRFDLGDRMTRIRECASSFEFDKALRLFKELRSGSPSEKILRKRIVLGVDDMPQLLTTLKTILGDKYKFVGATSGEAALKYLENNLPDVYILDIDMPGMDGFQLVDAIRAKRKIAPIIFLTANATAECVTKSFEAGITDFLVKPCNEESVHAKLEGIFSR